VDKIQDKLFPVLKRNEPTVEELTKEDYENRMGIKFKGPKGQKAKTLGSPLVKNPKPQDEAPVLTGTRKEIIETLKERGFKPGELNRKNKQQLMEML